uniref:Microfibril associated protein 4 n=1 Tax=Neogobius melanostomus TaxID=47308 RepID=A0A8C6U4F7_9GOBI
VILLFVAPVLFKATAAPVTLNPVDCNDVFYQNRTSPSGVYTIYPSDQRFGIPVYCDTDTEGGPWTVILRRSDGSENFYRPWDQYVAGFGDIKAEYWLGKEKLYLQTTKQKLRVELEDFEGSKTSVIYSSFSVGGDCEGYRLTVSGFINGGAGDSLGVHNGMKFSTFDRDQDTWVGNCAKSHMGGFWYHSCLHANPTGVYLWGDGATGAPAHTGVWWNSWRGNIYSLKTVTFMIHPLDDIIT